MAREHDLQGLIDLHRKRLQILERQRAAYGMLTPPHILMDIELALSEIAQLEQVLAQIVPQAQPVPAPTLTLAITVAAALDLQAMIRTLAQALALAERQISIRPGVEPHQATELRIPTLAAHRLLELHHAGDYKLQAMHIDDIQLGAAPAVHAAQPGARPRQIAQEDAMTRRVLLVDNDPDYLDSIADFLELADYYVYRAVSLDRARQLLDYVWVHIAIIDIRMLDDTDAKDDSGFRLAKDEKYRAIPKIMLTRHANYDVVRRALSPSIDGRPAAVDFFNKLDGPEALLRALDQTFAQALRINEQLKIAWHPLSSFPALVNLLLPPEYDNARLLDRCAELEDLLRKLFYDSAQITIGRVLKPGAGRFMLEIYAYNQAGAERQYVVACGVEPAITAENARYKDVVPHAAGNHSTIKALDAATLRFAASAYQLNGGDLETIESFREFYQSNQPAESVATCVEQIYCETLAPWYRKGRSQRADQPLGALLREVFGLQPEQLAHDRLGVQLSVISRQMLATGLVRQIKCADSEITLTFHSGAAARLANPAANQYEQRLSARVPVQRGIIHGQLDADSILVDHQSQTWLIDFSHAGQGLLLQDFVLLEIMIKLELLDTLDIELRYQLEQRLLAATDLATPLNDPALPAEIARALIVIERIRANAAALASADLGTYEAGLLFCTLGFLTSYQPELQYVRRRLMPYAHALLHAGLLCQKLLVAPPAPADLPSQAVNGLWLDMINQVAWVEGHEVALTSQEFKILELLAQTPGQLRTRQEISDMLGAEYDMTEESRLNSAISRLRQKLEAGPRRSRYLKTIRGRGYVLVLQPDRTVQHD
ncbi:MAG: DNA-binding response regulator [Kouleothrix sp.]|jgi:DNA-binding response OmpR family regulator|nr:DNA-binding response regulator [Kouleothrix sp.]